MPAQWSLCMFSSCSSTLDLRGHNRLSFNEALLSAGVTKFYDITKSYHNKPIISAFSMLYGKMSVQGTQKIMGIITMYIITHDNNSHQ